MDHRSFRQSVDGRGRCAIRGGLRLFLSCFAAVLVFSAGLVAQERSESVRDYRVTDLPGFLIVIFSPEVDVSGRTASQGVVWKSFIAKLRKDKVKSLEVINEVAVNDAADRARAFEVALGERNKHTIWLQFSARNDQPNVAESEKLVAKYIVFAPASNDILGQGEVEQERPLNTDDLRSSSRQMNQDIHRRATNTKSVMRIPDSNSNVSAQMLDVDLLSRVGEEIAARAIRAVTKGEREKKTP